MNELGWSTQLIALIIGLIVIAAVFFTAGMQLAQRKQDTAGSMPPASAEGEDPEKDTLPVAAVVINPSKFTETSKLRATISRVCQEEGWALPIFYETSKEETGATQTREAVDQGVDLVCALGGDGTVRAVAAGLIGSDTPLGVLPGGTGNLLARNLDLPLDNLSAALRVALTGGNRAIDVGVVNIDIPEDAQTEPEDHYFLVMAGVGFDADVVAQAPEDLKAHVGWAAYLVSGAKNLDGHRFAATLVFDEEESSHRRVRSVIIGNCGRLQGGVELLPDAEIDDGALDAVVLSPQGIVGWAGVGVRLLTKQRKGHPMVEHRRCTSLSITLDHPQEVQLDGDPLGPGLVLTVAVRRHALLIRTTAGSPT
ncbi:diacylglycerol/lipid kinase family protein [Austwickia chelonae]|uniref:diacylglycerol/lipid kinase family protein n=1 Tax=Austwickia chelonae TaxID=100225 RepID=UPI000E23CED6|nr:diacylglycerol kinase family protein [Austwickia chelonae]